MILPAISQVILLRKNYLQEVYLRIIFPKFKVNNSSEPVVIGSTGIYELELPQDVEITALSFEASSIASLSNLENGSLIVDIIYEDGEG